MFYSNQIPGKLNILKLSVLIEIEIIIFRSIMKLHLQLVLWIPYISSHLSSTTIEKIKLVGRKIKNSILYKRDYSKLTKINNFVVKNYLSLIIVKILTPYAEIHKKILI